MLLNGFPKPKSLIKVVRFARVFTRPQAPQATTLTTILMKSLSKADKTSNPRELFNSSGYCVKLRLKDAGNTCTVVCSTRSKQQYTISQNKTNQKQTHMRFKLNTPNTIIFNSALL